jgi:hypothetical protein
MSEPIEVVVFSKMGGPLTKRITLTADGKIASDGSACTMARGRARRMRIGDLGELAALIERLTSKQAIGLGALRDELPDEVGIVTKNALRCGVAANDVIARTGDNIVYRPARAALALFDYDTKGMSPAMAQRLVARGGFWATLVSVIPALGSAGHLIRLSTSAGLSRTDTGAKFPGSGGLHGYVAIADGADAVRFLKTLHARCWLAGFGWMNVGSAGQLLERSIIDRMVGAAERLVFEGPPVVEPPLHQDAAARRPSVVAGDVLDSLAACPPLSIIESQAFDQLRAQERVCLAPECAAKRAAWIAGRTAGLMQRTGMTEAEAKATLEKYASGLLLGSVELEFDDADLVGMTVADVLDDPERFIGETLADPIEGVADGRGKAKVMRDGVTGLPFIHSFSHGQTVYRLRYDAAGVRTRLAAATEAAVVATFIKLALAADLSAVEIDELAHDAAKRSGAGVRAIKATLKTAGAEQHKQQAEATRTRARAMRTDPRPIQKGPMDDAPWLPVVGAINVVAAAAKLVSRPRRDIDGSIMRERRMPVGHTHAFGSANEEEEDDDQSASS